MTHPIDSTPSDVLTLGHIVADLDDVDATAAPPLQWTVRPRPRRRATPWLARTLAHVARLLGPALAALLSAAIIACGDATSPARTPAPVPVPVPVPVASVAVTPAERTLVVGESLTLGVTLRDASGAPLTGRTVSWASDVEQAATIDQTGRLLALAPGVARIAAVSEGQRGTTTITVTAPRVPVARVTVTADDRPLEAGDVVQLRATVADSAGRPLDDRVVVWSASDTAAATVSAAGLVTTRRGGPLTITAASEGRSASVQLTVGDAPGADLLYQRSVPDTNEIFIVGTAPGSVPVRVNAGVVSRRPTASPDGRRIAFAVSMVAPTGEVVDDIFAVDRTGLDLRRLTTAAGWDDTPAWSPDAALIAYLHRDAASGREDVWVMRADGSDPRNLTADLPGGLARGEPAWSPDGAWIAFTQSRGTAGPGRGSIWIMRADGSAKRQLTSHPDNGFDLHPSWAPDGTRIAFARGGLAIVTVATGDVVRLALPGYATAPAWSPDGRHLAFAWQPSEPGAGTWDLYTVRPDGSDMRRRATDAARSGSTLAPSWIRRVP